MRVFSQLAAMGYETAQANAAFILSQSPPACAGWLASDVVESLAQDTQSEEHGDGNVGEDVDVGGEVASAAIIGEGQWAAARNYSEFTRQDSGGGAVSPAQGEEGECAGPSGGVQQSKQEDGHGDGQEDGQQQHEGGDREYVIADLLEARALSLYRQSALLGNADSFRKMGDLHYYGSGGLVRDKHEAALLYQLAADYGQTHAMFNLGVMHDMGDGVEQDFHLAKRYYDQTAEFDPSARVPSLLAVYILRAHKEFQLYAGKDVTDQMGAVVMQVLAPLLQMSDWRDSVTGMLFPERNISMSASTGIRAYGYASEAADKEDLSPVSLLLWRCWDKFHQVWGFVTTTAQEVSGYLLRFSTRFSKSPQQAVSSLTSKATEFMRGENHPLNNEEDVTAPISVPPASGPMHESEPSATSASPPEGLGFLNMDADFELILLLILLFIFVALVDLRRERLRVARSRARERRRRVWDTITVVEMRDLILEQNAE